MRIDINDKAASQQLPTAAIATIFCEIADLLRPMLKAQQEMNRKMDELIQVVKDGTLSAEEGKALAIEMKDAIHATKAELVKDVEERKAARVKS